MLYLPSWLPESIALKVGKEQFLVEYTLRAQFTPNIELDIVSDMRFPLRFKNVSLYRGSRSLIVYSQAY